MEKLKVLELFSGTQSISKAFRKKGHETFTVDFNEIFKEPEYCNTDLFIDILKLTPEMVIEKFGHPDVIWCSPPCTKFSVAAIGRNWTKEGDLYTPKNKDAEIAMDIVKHTIYLIKELKPRYFFIENPRGMLRKLPFMQELTRYTTTYCQYGDERMKPTDLWTNHPDPEFKLPCKNGSPCHVAAPRGSRTGTQGLKNAIERARIPDDLCSHIVNISEKVYCNEDLSLDALKLKKKELQEESYEDEWKNEFTRQEIKEINALIKAKEDIA